jgi:hypothetical protein
MYSHCFVCLTCIHSLIFMTTPQGGCYSRPQEDKPQGFMSFYSSLCYLSHSYAPQRCVEWMSFIGEETEAQLGLRWHNSQAVRWISGPRFWLHSLCGFTNFNSAFKTSSDVTFPGISGRELDLLKKTFLLFSSPVVCLRGNSASQALSKRPSHIAFCLIFESCVVSLWSSSFLFGLFSHSFLCSCSLLYSFWIPRITIHPQLPSCFPLAIF